MVFTRHQKLHQSHFESKTIITLLISLLSLFYIVYLFLLNGLYIIDIDFGWQIRMGEWIFHNGIPKTDPLSYTMPGYLYINHEWLTNIIFYILYSLVGIPGLTVIFIFLTLLAIWLQIPKRQLFWSIPGIILSSTIFLTFFQLRAQVLSWLFFSLFLVIAFNESHWKRRKWVIPFLVALWVNIHGSFGMGILVILFVSIHNYVLNKKLLWTDVVIIFLCVIATFINPYGLSIWHEVFLHMSNSYIKTHFGRWMPLYFSININTLFYIFYIVTSYILILFSKKIIPLSRIIFLTVLLILAFSGIIYVPFYVLASLPLLTNSISYLGHTSEKQKTRKTKFEKIFIFAFILIIVFCLFEAVHEAESFQSLTEKKAYPGNAISFLKKHLPKNQIMSVYEWGGYLDWKLPEKKVFIDGRMLVWTSNTHPKNESSNIFMEDEMFLNGKIPLAAEVKKYGIDTLLFPVTLGKNAIIEKQIKQARWKIRYQDEVAVIYEKN